MDAVFLMMNGENAMELKLFEIRDAGTFIPMYAFKFIHMTEQEVYLARRSGYEEEGSLIAFGSLQNPEETHYDPICWSYGRTRQVAHEYIRDNWNILKSGDVIDVEWILGERDTPKKSESEIDFNFI